MKVLHVIARMNVGGTARYVGDLVSAAPAGFETLLATGYVQGSEVEDPCVYGLPVARISAMGRAINPIADIRAYFQLKRVIRDFKPDIVHSHTFKAGLLARLIPGSHKRVHTFHGHLFDDQSFSGLQKFVITFAERFNAKRTDLLISVGEKVGRELRAARIGNGKKWASIAPGVKPLATLPYNGEFVVGWMARVTSVKNPMLAGEVARLLPSVSFVMAGGGDLLNEVKAVAPSNLSVIGWADAAQFWSSVSIALSTSDNEGMPIALIEAQLAGIPVVATDVGSNSEVISSGQTGLVVEKNAAAIAMAISQLATDSQLRAQMGQAAQERALRVFSPEAMIATHGELYLALFRPAI
jgi:glycosyltransferase involved in cell wall biosynthesis